MQIMFSLLADPVFMRGCLSWRNAPAVLDRDGNDCLIRDRDLVVIMAVIKIVITKIKTFTVNRFADELSKFEFI